MDGDEDFADFVSTRMPAMLRYAHLLAGDRGRAEDLVQAALAATYRHWRRIEPGSAEAYVRRAVLDGHLTWWRRGWRRERVAPRCVRLEEVIGRVERLDALVLRCVLPEHRAGTYTVLLAQGVRLTGMSLAAGTGPAERDLDHLFPTPLEGGFTELLGPEFPTGGGRLTLVDAAGRALPDVEIPAYS